MNHNQQTGVLRPFIDDFILLRHHLGYKSKSMEGSLKAFDVFARKEGLSQIEIPQELAQKWCGKRKGEANNTWTHRVGFLKQFAVYLLNLGYKAYIPGKPPAKHDVFEPYIFSTEEMDRIFKAADSLRMYDRHTNTTLLCIPIIIRTLYATGIRIGEALGLAVDDVNLQRNYLTIKGGKNGKDRMVPFSENLAKEYLRYLEIRRKLPGHCDQFFIKPNGLPCQISGCYSWWNKILRMSNIPHRGRIPGPRLHDLRHTFCVRSMYAMSKEGKDMLYSLPVLSVYIGHSSIAATDRYVRMTSEMYPDLVHKMESICSYIYPNIKNREP